MRGWKKIFHANRNDKKAGVATFFFFFMVVLDLFCCVQAFSSCGEQGLLFVVVSGLLIVVASLVAEHGL